MKRDALAIIKDSGSVWSAAFSIVGTARSWIDVTTTTSREAAEAWIRQQAVTQGIDEQSIEVVHR